MATNRLDFADDKLGNVAGRKQVLRGWLRLLTCSHHITHGIRTLLRTRHDTTLPRFDVMAALERAPEGLSMGELSHWLMVTNANITNIADRLVKDGSVERWPSPDDRRTHYLKLTDKGLLEFKTMAKMHEDYVRKIFACLSTEELETLMLLLNKIKSSAVELNERGLSL
ncbi:MAG: MarR family transcriptional regulator [Gammaproteobacteria bacterium]|nr:MarR family transcriptional regulator [Gammaproteobacteria bacterium]